MRISWILIGLLLPGLGTAQPIAYSFHYGDLNRFELPSGNVVETVDFPDPSSAEAMTLLPSGELLVVDDRRDLWRLDPGAGTADRIGATGAAFGRGAGLTQDACGSLWLAVGTNLYTLDADTGEASLVTPLTREVHALTSYGTSLLGLVDTDGRRLGRIDPETGIVEAFGEPATAASTAKGLDFDANGRLWAVSAATNNPPVGDYTIVEYDPQSGDVLQELFQAFGFSVFRGNLAISPPRGACGDLADVPVLPAAVWVLAAALVVAGVLRSRLA